jgi:HlyD family secretion protein
MTKERSMRVNFKRPALIGLLTVLLLIGAGLTWASLAKVSGAVMGGGSVGVTGKPKTIQHLDGGIVDRIMVEPGQRVKKDQELVFIDDRTVLANLTIYRGRLRDLLVRKQRLIAELDGGTEFVSPDTEMQTRYSLGSYDAAMAQQKSMLMARRSSMQGEIAQLSERISQFNKQIAGVESLKESKKTQLAVYGQERSAIEKLVKLSLAAKNQLLVFDRNFADFGGQIAEHESEIGRLRNSISEVEISKLQVERNFREKVITELDEIDAKIDELTQQIDATDQQLKRTIIRSPVDGMVHELSLFTIGGVIQPGQAIMQIVPQSSSLDIEVNVETQYVDQISIGQKAVVRLPAFHQRTTPELFGTIMRISPTSVVDEKNGFSFYRVGIAVSEAELKQLGNLMLVPGMPVEAVIPTGDRTVLEYLVKPLSDNIAHAFREE